MNRYKKWTYTNKIDKIMSNFMKEQKLTISDFHRPDPIPKEAILKVNELLQKATLFRYIGENPEDSETALLERDFAAYVGTKYALALNSCSSALFLSLLACSIKPGDQVLIPAFTFTAVPSAIMHAGAAPVLVECNERYCIDLEDLKRKISPQTKVLLLSHMRGHTSDLDEITKICEKNNVTLIEDAAHSLGVLWNGKPVGTYGKTGCYSFQSYKIINGGEGGMLVTNDEELIVKAIYLSGAYEKTYLKHFVQSELFEKYQNSFPAFNLRMDNISAATIRPQLNVVEEKVATYNKNYQYLTNLLSSSEYIEVPSLDSRERMAPDTIQFNLKGLTIEQSKIFMNKVREAGVSLYVFGADENNARLFWNWKYLPEIPVLENTKKILQFTCDMRLPVFFTDTQLDYIASVISKALGETVANKS